MNTVDFNFNNPLPEIYEKEMPEGLDTYQRFEWRRHKFGELRMNGLVTVDVYGNCTFVDTTVHVSEAQSTQSKQNLSEFHDTNVAPVIEKPIEKHTDEKASKKNVTKKAKAVKDADDEEQEYVRSVPKSVMNALRRRFPNSTNRSDLISAAVYIFTDGDCVISEKAQALVDAYKKDDEFETLNERLDRIERVDKRILEKLSAVELCACYNTFDRRYGSNEPRVKPGATEFREKDNLDMLERLREQAKDQLNLDNLTLGRQIYNQTKDLKD